MAICAIVTCMLYIRESYERLLHKNPEMGLDIDRGGREKAEALRAATCNDLRPQCPSLAGSMALRPC